MLFNQVEDTENILTGKRNANAKFFDKLSEGNKKLVTAVKIFMYISRPDKQISINSNSPDALLKVLVTVSSCLSDNILL